jgi:acetyl esterase/lipase
MRAQKTAACAALLAAVATAGCGSGSSSSERPHPTSHRVVERFYGKGADSVWVFRRQNDRPKAVVVFLHGLYDRVESTPLNHLDFVRHLAGRGYAVVYPRFEQVPRP